MGGSLVLPVVLAALFISLRDWNVLAAPIGYSPQSYCSDQLNLNPRACELEETKLRIARLESILEERIGELNAKSLYISDCEKKIKELNAEVDRLKAAFSSFENEQSRANLKISALEEEIRLLWAASRKNNFEIYALEYKASDAEKRLKQVTSQVGEMAEIVSEQWIQVQKLEQAVYMAQVRTSEVRKELWNRCPFVKFFRSLFDECRSLLKGVLDPYVQHDKSVLLFCKSQVLQAFAAVKHYHHQLQGFIKHAMGSHELTAALAHEEVVFFMASALVVFPIINAFVVLLSQFS